MGLIIFLKKSGLKTKKNFLRKFMIKEKVIFDTSDKQMHIHVYNACSNYSICQFEDSTRTEMFVLLYLPNSPLYIHTSLNQSNGEISAVSLTLILHSWTTLEHDEVKTQ